MFSLSAFCLSLADFVAIMLYLSFAASSLQFNDSEKSRLYESISFNEVYDEITELKVAPVLLLVITPFPLFFPLWSSLLPNFCIFFQLCSRHYSSYMIFLFISVKYTFEYSNSPKSSEYLFFDVFMDQQLSYL